MLLFFLIFHHLIRRGDSRIARRGGLCYHVGRADVVIGPYKRGARCHSLALPLGELSPKVTERAANCRY